MTIESTLTIIAILASPLIAIQISRYIDDSRDHRSRRIQIYRTLMSTRASSLSPSHVESLNSIDLEFTNKSDKAVKLAWKAYLAHLSDTSIGQDIWASKKTELLVRLLSEMGQALGYDYDETHIERGVYDPVHFNDVEEDQNEIRRGLRRLLQGELVLPLRVVDFDNTSASGDL